MRLGIQLAVLTLLPCLALAQDSVRYPFLDPSLPLDRRVNDLVSRMTVEEKVDQMQYQAPAIPRLDDHHFVCVPAEPVDAAQYPVHRGKRAC